MYVSGFMLLYLILFLLFIYSFSQFFLHPEEELSLIY
jgi:hypothetical protein